MRGAQEHPLALFILVLVFVMIVAAMRGWFGKGQHPQQDKARNTSATWARANEIRDLLIKNPSQDRVVLGAFDNTMLAVPERRSVAVIAPTGRGKTPKVVVPAALRATGPMVLTSVKTDALALTIDHRRTVGPVWVFDPTGATGEPSCTWSPLSSAGDYAGALKAASWLVESSKVGGKGVEDQKFWDQLGKNLLAPMLFAAARSGRQMDAVVDWILFQSTNELDGLLEGLGDRTALGHWESIKALPERTRGSVFATAQNILDPFGHPEIRDAVTTSSSREQFDPDRLLDENGTLYIVAPQADQELFTPVFESLVNAVVRVIERRSAPTGLPIDPPLLLMLDEAANCAPLRRLDKLASAGAGQGIILVSIWQDEGQIEEIYGHNRARTVLANHTARVYLAGVSDPETLDHLSTLIGNHMVRHVSRSTDARGGRSSSADWKEERVAPPEYLRQLPDDTAIVVLGRFKPIRLTMVGWYDDKTLRARVNPQTAQSFDRVYAGARR